MSWLSEKITELKDALQENLARGGAPSAGNIALGNRGEKAARRFLKCQGYDVVTRNFRASGAEIDIIALDGPTLVFIEVKTRSSFTAGRPEEAVDEDKQLHIRRAAEVFAARYRATNRPRRFDVVAISGDPDEGNIELLKDAF